MYAVNVARYHLFPETKEMGMHGVPNLCILTSEQVKELCYVILSYIHIYIYIYMVDVG